MDEREILESINLKHEINIVKINIEHELNMKKINDGYKYSILKIVIISVIIHLLLIILWR